MGQGADDLDWQDYRDGVRQGLTDRPKSPPEPEAPAAPSGVRYYVHLDGRVWGITDDREWWCQVIPVEDAAFVAALLEGAK